MAGTPPMHAYRHEAFFALVGKRANTELRGKPNAVVGDGGRTVIITCSQEARKSGAKTGTAIFLSIV